MLAEHEQGGGKGVALFAPLRLGYAVADPLVVPPTGSLPLPDLEMIMFLWFSESPSSYGDM